MLHILHVYIYMDIYIYIYIYIHIYKIYQSTLTNVRFKERDWVLLGKKLLKYWKATVILS